MNRSLLPLTALARACVFTLAFGAAAQASAITVTKDATQVNPYLFLGVHKDQASRFEFSSLFVSALDVTRAQVAPIAPGTATITLDPLGQDAIFTTISLDMPVSSLTGDYTAGSSLDLSSTNSFTTQSIEAAGGLSIQTTGMYTRPDGSQVRNPAAKGGTLQITNLEVDLVRNVIRADVVGANGAGTHNDLTMWHIGQALVNELDPIDVCTAGIPPNFCATTISTSATLTGLRIDPLALDIFSTSLGLTSFGKSAFLGITDYGTLVVGVPEPATWLTMGLGLAGMGLIGRRRQAAI